MTSRKIFFFHIPKTAGTSLTVALSKHFADHKICPFAHQQELSNLNAGKLKKWDFFKGHLSLSIRNHLPNPFVFTFLRDPVERTLSEYHYLTTQQTEIEEEIRHKNYQPGSQHPFYIYQGMDFLDLVRKNPAYMKEQFNLQTGCLADLAWDDRSWLRDDGTNFLNKALAEIQNLDFVGLVEQMETSRILLSWQLQIPLLGFTQSFKINQHKPAGGWRQQLAGTESQLTQLAELDCQLYAAAKQRLDNEWHNFCKTINIHPRYPLDEAAYTRVNAILNQRAKENPGKRPNLADHLRQCEKTIRSYRKKLWAKYG